MVYSNKHIDLNVVDALYKKGYEYHMNEEWIEAAKYYQEAASFGHTEAMEALGEFYINGLEGRKGVRNLCALKHCG